MKRKPVVFVVLFFVILSLLAGLTFGLPAKEFSANENRYLAQMPAFSVDALLSGEFQSQLDTFLSDQIPLREFWIETNTNIKKWLGKTEINGVYFGSDGYYFQQFTESNYSASRKDAVFALLERFAGKQTASVTVMPVPTPGAVLADKLPTNAPMYDADAMWEDLKAAVPSAGFVDLRKTFYNAKEQLYYRTDHHWTAYGAYEAYVRYCASAGLTAKPLDHFNLELFVCLYIFYFTKKGALALRRIISATDYASTAHTFYLLYRHASVEKLCYFHRRFFAHSINKNIRTRIN